MLFMQKFNSSSPYRTLLAISFAILFHTILAISLFQILPKIETEKTVSIQLTISSQASSSAIQTRANNAANKPEESAEEILNKEKAQNASKEVITSTGESLFSDHSSTQQAEKTDQKTTPDQSTVSVKQENIFIPKIKTDLPDVRRDIAISSKSQAASKSFTEISSLFQQQESETEVVQTSSDPEREKISAYEEALRKKLTQAQYQDKLYPIISKLSESKLVSLELVIFPNGSIRNVLIKKSSNDQKLDQAVRRIALEASPYPEPPKEDRSFGYKYNITIRYEPPSAR